MNTLRLAQSAFSTTILVSILLWILMPSATFAQAEGTISGVVVNQTIGEPLVNVEVTLSAFNSDGLIGDTTVMSDAEGRYVFDGVDVADGIVYAASVSHRGVLYSTGMIQFQGTAQQETAIDVYETTTDRSVVNVTSRGIVLSEVSPEDGEAMVLDIYSLAVEGDQTFVAGDTGRSIEFSIPRNAASVTPMSGFDFGNPEIENSTVYATSPLRPGSASATLSYVVRYTGTDFSIDTRNAYPTGTFRILIPTDLSDDAGEVSVRANGFVDEGTTTIGGREYHVWGAADLDQGSSTRIAFESLPESAFEPNQLRVLEPALLAGLAVVIATAFTAMLVRRRRLVPALATETGQQHAAAIDSREELVLQLQELQDEHENGLIDDELYLTERRSILERLRIVSRRLRDEPGPDHD